jgi:hypothetical protein
MCRWNQPGQTATGLAQLERIINKRMKTIVKLATIALTLSTINVPLSTILAQGTGFTYQGRLNDGGSPANGSYDIAFSLYATNAEGVAFAGPVTNAAVGVTNGLFTTTVDFGNVFTGASNWLAMAVSTNAANAFSTVSPRQQLTPAPYAIYAENAATAASAASVAALNITGTLTTAQLPVSVVTNGATAVSISGTFSGNGAGLTNVPGTMPWQTVAGTNLPAAANQAYLLTNQALSTVTLPTSANPGDIVTVSGVGSNGWQVTTSPGQTVAGLFVPAGVIWTNVYVANSNLVSLASSANGNILVAVDQSGAIVTSTNSGLTWSSQNLGVGPGSICSSSDGTKMALASYNGVSDQGAPIYTSTNSGLTWKAQTNYSGRYWAIIVSSADGTKLVAAPSGPSYLVTSTDSGANWTLQANSGLLTWKSLASSANGNILVAADQPGDILTSTNSGVTWSSQNLGVGWGTLCSSSDGTKMALAPYHNGQGGYIYTSTNSGLTWTAQTNGPFGIWASAFSFGPDIACSTDGTKLIAAGNGIIYTSTNSGVTWTAQNSGLKNWTSVASSADGSKLVATADSGIYTSGPVQYPYVGAANSTEQFQYVGNGVWQPVSISAGALPGSVVTNTEKGVTLSGTFSGNGIGLTNLNASQLASGTVPASALNGANGGGLTNLNASHLTSGTVADALLSANVPLLSSGKLSDSVLSTNVLLLSGGNVALRSSSNTFNGTQIITNGNVGIGTTNPGLNNLQINSTNVWANGYGLVVSRADYGAEIQINQGSLQAGIGLALDNADNGDATSMLLIRNNVNAPSWQTVMDARANGNVGVGVYGPTARMQVAGAGIVNVFAGDRTPFGVAGFETDFDSRQTHIWCAETGTNVFNVTGGGAAFFAGSVGIGTSAPTNKLHVMGGATFSSGAVGPNQNVIWVPGSASWSFTSDRNAKDRVEPVDTQSVLDKVTRIAINEWSYIGYDQRHIGPMAQDFHEQFPLNENDKALNDADLHGVTLAAIQGLNEKVESGKQKTESRVQQLEQKLEQKETEITELKVRLQKLEELFEQKRDPDRK